MRQYTHMKKTRSGLLIPEGLPEWRLAQDENDYFGEPLYIPRGGKRTIIFHPVEGGSRQYFIEPMAPIMMADQTTITGTTEAVLWPVSPWTAMMANQLQPGQIYRFTASGVMSTASSTPGTLTLTPRWGTTSGGTSFGASAASATMTTSVSAAPWRLECELACRANGTAASSYLTGEFGCDQAGVARLMFGGPLTNIDTTTPQGLWIGATLGSASDNMTTRLVLVEAVN